ncbi:hypothetical protein ACJIZ3_022245 [Penstemon smallii]|uniref:Uncharacterized protein n=1 Tax=Penstemon smallii TaxID=265156 RepID=A0ABD3SPC2_9LAMI
MPHTDPTHSDPSHGRDLIGRIHLPEIGEVPRNLRMRDRLCPVGSVEVRTKKLI